MESENKNTIIYKFIPIAIIIACVSSMFTSFYMRRYIEKNYLGVTGDISEDSEKSVEDLTTLLESFRELIDKYYVGEIDEDLIVEETIKGYVNGLGDEYSEYMTADEWEEFEMNALGTYVGIGIYMSEDENGNAIVLSTVEESPAEKAGLMENDIICEVDGTSTIGLGSSTVSDMVKGEEGTKVKIVVLRGKEYITKEIERKSIKLYKVQGEIIEKNIGYIKISTFDDGCSNEFEEKYKELKEKGAKKLIIDLRNNTGGVVDEALAISEMIVDKGSTMLITVDANDEKDVTVSEKEPIVDCDVVVLINEYSASASEILAGCLKDNGKAKLVGNTTFGKGVIQTVLQLTDGSVLKLTTAEYFTPNETKINKIGIEPDEKIELVDDENETDEQLEKAVEILKK